MPHTSEPMLELYASCPEGFEVALADELRVLGLRQVRRLKGRVTFSGNVRDAYRACLWSRLASRIFVTVARFDCHDADDLYRGARSVAWERILRPGATIAVTARGTNDELRNSHFVALRVKDALCDHLAEAAGRRPNVDVDDPDARLLLTLRGERASLHLDLSGDPLFKRLPREATHSVGAHVLRPDYAALLLAQLGWSETCTQALINDRAEEGAEVHSADEISSPKSDSDSCASTPIFPILLDLSCAGGGVVLEAASILADRAPGALRTRWGFQGWALHDPVAWRKLLEEAHARENTTQGRAARIVATDISGEAVALARRVLKAANLDHRVIFAQPDAEKIARKLGIPSASAAETGGLMVLDTTEVPLTKLPRALSLLSDLRAGNCMPGHFGELVGDCLRDLPLAVLSRDALALPTCGSPRTELQVKPNNEDALMLTFSSFAEVGGANAPGSNSQGHSGTAIDLGDGTALDVLIPKSEQFARRLRKVAKQRRKWAQREGVSCYRVYDADLPDYSAAIDLYEGCPATPGRWLVIAEYAAPREVDPQLAQARLLDILTIAPRILDAEPERVFAKARIRSRGGSQYGKGSGGVNAAERTRAKGNAAPAHKGKRANKTLRSGSGDATPSDIRTRPLPLIKEGGLTFAVNFNDYLDTGIFLDHRVTRGLVRKHARGKRWFLNLFAYTGTATCYAADAGVEETVTVDLSNTYLDWAERNMEQNGFTGPEHHFVRADVMAWIDDMRRTSNRWDLIFCDPPTFSNSSKMGQRTWDVQRDHVELLYGLSRLLTRDGEAIFSCNLRTFRPDLEALAELGVELADITAETIPEDFARNPRIHRCYIVRRK